VMITAPQKETLKSGRLALKGNCPHCNTKTFKIIGKE